MCWNLFNKVAGLGPRSLFSFVFMNAKILHLSFFH